MTMVDRIRAAEARRESQAERIRMALAKAGLDNLGFEAASERLGRKIGRNRIARLQKGTAKRVLDDELYTVAIVCGVEPAFVQGEEVTLPAFDASLDIPGYTPLGSREARWTADILNSDRGIDHPLGGCDGCRNDRDFHVLIEDKVPGGGPGIPGQTELVLDIEEMLEGVA